MYFKTLIKQLKLRKFIENYSTAKILINKPMSDSSTNYVAKCIFCQVIKENDPNKILFKDDTTVIFSDIRPAAKHHYLICSIQHIRDPKHLTKEHQDLVQHMIDVGLKYLTDSNGDLNDLRTGFHWPPCHSVAHLHLHVISPASEMGFINKLIFRLNSWWFVSPEYVLSTLENKL